MARFLFGWEFGSGLGHVSPISEFADRLAKRGHEVHAVTRDVYASVMAFGDFSIPCYALPKAKRPRKPIRSTASMAEVLYNVGYHSSAQLAVKLMAWRSLINTVRPDVMIVNYAPTAILAARELPVRVLQFGTGFEVPPAQAPIPGFSQLGEVPGERLRTSEAAMVGKVNRAVRRLGLTEIADLQEAFRADRDILVTLRELDHYRDRDDGDYAGPLLSAPFSRQPEWPRNGEGSRRIFCYLKAKHEGVENTLKCLGALDASVLIYVSGPAASLRREYASTNMRFVNRPVDLRQACKDSDIVVCHAGHGTVATALLKGARLLLMPEKRNIEQWITAKNITRLRAGLAISPDNGRKEIAQALEMLFATDARFRTEKYRKQYEGYDPDSAWRRLERAAEELAC